MPQKIYRSDNYIIVERDGKLYEYAITKTAYTRNDEGGIDKFEVVESAVSSRLSGRSTIPVSEVDAGDWEDDGAVVYTTATLTLFLRQNTANFSKGGASTFAELTDVPPYLSNALKGLRINAAENGLEAYTATDLNQWLVPLTAFVDPTGGNDGTGTVGDGNLPFKTLGFAQAAADYVICLPGNYGGVNILANNKNIHFLQGCISTGSNFTDAGNTANVNISGHLYFAVNSRGFLIFGANSNWSIEIDEMYLTRKIAHVTNGSVVNLTANRILTKNTTVSGYACYTSNGGKLTLNVKEKLTCYHWLATTFVESAGGIYGDNIFTLNCPNVEMSATSTYGNTFKALINDQSRSKGIYNINIGKFKNNSLTQTTAFGIVEGGIGAYIGGTGNNFASEYHFTGDYDTGKMYGWFDYYRIYEGLTTFKNGSLTCETVPFSSIAVNVVGVVNRTIVVENFHFEGGLTADGFNQIGNGRVASFINCTFKNINVAGTRLFNHNNAFPIAGAPFLYLYNCIGDMENAGAGALIGGAVLPFNFASVNTYSSEPIGASVVDSWLGYTQIVGFTIPKF